MWKEFFNSYGNNVKFEGEYLKGKIWNGKGYTYNSKKIYEIINGKGILQDFNDNNELLFKYEYDNGEINGYGEEYAINSHFDYFYWIEKKCYYKKFCGNYSNGKRNGEGEEYNPDNKLLFKGEYFNGKKWNGKIYNKEGKEEFEIKCGNGKVKEYNEKGNLLFEGEYLNGERNGKGKEYYYNQYGKGNSIYEGEFLNGEKNGKGKEFYYNGKLKFEGEFINGERNGKGKEYDSNGKLLFEGEFINGERI